MPYQSDYILRMIEMVGQAIRRIVSALREQRPNEATGIAGEAVSEIMGVAPDTLDRLSGPSIVTLLSFGGAVDGFKAHMVGELLYARADAYRDAGLAIESARDVERATAVLSAALPYVQGDDLDRVEELLDWLRDGVWVRDFLKGG